MPTDPFDFDAMRAWQQQAEMHKPFLPAATRGGRLLAGPGGGTQVPFQPNWRFARIVGQIPNCSGSGSASSSGQGPTPPYLWQPVQPNQCGQWIPSDETDFGTDTYQWAFEANGNPLVPLNTVVMLWEFFLDTGPTGTGRNYVFWYQGLLPPTSGSASPSAATPCLTFVEDVSACPVSGSGSPFGTQFQMQKATYCLTPDGQLQLINRWCEWIGCQQLNCPDLVQGSGSGGGSDGQVICNACPNPIPATLYAVFRSFTGQAQCLNGSVYPLTNYQTFPNSPWVSTRPPGTAINCANIPNLPNTPCPVIIGFGGKQFYKMPIGIQCNGPGNITLLSLNQAACPGSTIPIIQVYPGVGATLRCQPFAYNMPKAVVQFSGAGTAYYGNIQIIQ